MDRQTRTITRHHFTFQYDEIKYFGIESERLDYMVNTAIKSLIEDGYPTDYYESKFDYGNFGEPATLTLYI